jgi:hypothetical protein
MASCEAEHGSGTEAASACIHQNYCRQEYPEGAAIAARLLCRLVSYRLRSRGSVVYALFRASIDVEPTH